MRFDFDSTSIRLRFDCDVVIKITIQLRFDCDSTMTKNEHVHFFVALIGIVANKKAAVGA